MAIYYTNHPGGKLKLFSGKISRRLVANIYKNKNVWYGSISSIFKMAPNSIFFSKNGRITHVFDVNFRAFREPNTLRGWLITETLFKKVVEPGIFKGDVCGRDGCKGILDEHQPDRERGGCTCFQNAPCSFCVDDRTYCPECDWGGSDEQHSR